MNYQHVIKTSKRIFWLNCKKHYCPVCKASLRIEEASKIVNSKSEEAKHYDFHFGETSMIGDVKFIWDELACDSCGRRFKIEEIFQKEKEAKRSAKTTD